MTPHGQNTTRRAAATACAVGALAAGLALTALVGCSPKTVLGPKSPPETTVFVQGTLDTVSYKVHLYWFGTDPDGSVATYELRFLHLDPPADADTQWVRTTRTDSVFFVYTPAGVSTPVFEVRAIDDDGMVDPTPARQAFTFRNLPPTLTILSGPGPNDVTFASVTLTWSATDPDGDIRKAKFRVWLDGHEADPNVLTATTFTVPTDQFRQGGALLSGYRTVSLQAIDDAGYATPAQSLRWYVRAPVPGSRARLLIVDDEPGNTGPQFRQDTLYVNAAVRKLLPPGSRDTTWSILRLESSQPFRSTMDLEQTLKLFEAVVWYRGASGTLQPILTNYLDGLAHYLESGGRFFIESQQLVQGQGAQGILPESWVTQYLGSDFLHQHPAPSAGVAWGIATVDCSGNPVKLFSTVFHDSLRMTFGGYGQLRGFAIRDSQYAAIWAPPGALTQCNAIFLAVAVSVPQPGGGRLVAVTLPLRSADGFSTVPRFLASVYDQLGLSGP